MVIVEDLREKIRVRYWVKRKCVYSIVGIRVEELIERSERLGLWAVTI